MVRLRQREPKSSGFPAARKGLEMSQELAPKEQWNCAWRAFHAMLPLDSTSFHLTKRALRVDAQGSEAAGDVEAWLEAC